MYIVSFDHNYPLLLFPIPLSLADPLLFSTVYFQCVCPSVLLSAAYRTQTTYQWLTTEETTSPPLNIHCLQIFREAGDP